MAVNDRTAVSRFAEIAGVAVEDLCANAAISVGKRLYDIRGELVTAEFLANPYTVFCPACLARDDETGIRCGRWTR